MKVSGFWNRQNFSYLVTYSFNRGPKLEALIAAAKGLFQVKRQALLSVTSAQLPLLRTELRLLEQVHNFDQLTLTNKLDTFQVTATPIATLKQDSEATQLLASFLQLPVVNQSAWMCTPVYRDALAFYNAQDKLLSLLNICFNCDRMVTNTGVLLEADVVTYQQLGAYLTQLGHPIERY